MEMQIAMYADPNSRIAVSRQPDAGGGFCGNQGSDWDASSVEDQGFFVNFIHAAGVGLQSADLKLVLCLLLTVLILTAVYFTTPADTTKFPGNDDANLRAGNGQKAMVDESLPVSAIKDTFRMATALLCHSSQNGDTGDMHIATAGIRN